jgi:D-sedoheptulose 7-phosphate isomerase
MSVEPQTDLYARYISVFSKGLSTASATDAGGASIAADTAVRDIGAKMRACHDGGRRIMLVGNGGSAGICSHLATDFSKNGGMRATAFNDGSVLTCLGNDYGYEHVFAKQIEWHGVEGDMLIAISSSGRSTNILNAVASARKLKCVVVTLSGFKPDNPLRALGDINIYFPSSEYGFVEVGHLAILHAALDIQMGWQGNA